MFPDADTEMNGGASCSDNRHSMFYGGIRSRMRLRNASTSSNSSTGNSSLGDIRNSLIIPTDTVIRRNDQTTTEHRAAAPAVPACATNGSINWDQRQLVIIPLLPFAI